MNFLQDLRYGVRMLTKAPVVMAVAAVSLALGIAATTTTFSVANSFMLEPLPYEDQDGLVICFEYHRSTPGEGSNDLATPGNYFDWVERATVFEDVLAYSVGRANLTGAGEPERINVALATPNTFSLLGRAPFLGRDFRDEEGVEGAGQVVVLSHPFWQRRFAGDPGIVGRTLTLDGTTYTVVGAMAEEFEFIPANVDLYRPTDWENRRQDREERMLFVVGRLKPGRTVDEAQAELSTIAHQLEEEHPDTNEGYRVRALGLREWFPGPTDTKLIYIIMTVAGCVLLIACANVANLLLARAEARQKEVAVRTALGAGRRRILRQLMTESVLLAFIGGALGTVLSIWSIRFLGAAMPAEMPRTFWPELDGTVLLFTLVLSVLAGITFGVAPALHSFARDLRDALGDGSHGGTASRRRNRLRSAFVIGEMAAALALLTGAGLLMAAFEGLMVINPGFRVDGLLTLQLTVPESRYPEDGDVAGFYNGALRQLAEVPGVAGVAAMNVLPRSRNVSSTGFTIDGRPEPRRNEEPRAVWQAVNPDYFSVLGAPILRGRGLAVADRADAPLVVVVNQLLAEHHFPGEDPVGQRITIFGESREIVGIAGNIFHTRLPVEGRFPLALYLPLEQHPVRTMGIALRTAGDPASLSEAVRAAVWAVDPDQPVSAIQTLQEHIEVTLAGPRVISIVLGAFGTVALLLSAIGIYGVMAHAVVQRTREIGIRVALGANRAHVVRLVTRQGMRLAGVGLLLGVPLAYGMILAVRSTLAGFTAVNPPLFAAVLTTLLLISFFSSYLPARRASRVDPVRALRTE